MVYSPWIIAAHYKRNYSANLRAFIPTGDSANFDIEATSEEGIMLEYGGYTDDLIALETAQTAAITVPLAQPYMAYRLKINSGGPVVLRLIPSTTA